MASDPHGARAALTGSIPVRIDTADTVRTRANDDRFGRMVGKSPAMQTVFDVLNKASSSDATILLEGETGTGKEVSAEAIHRGSARRDKPFLVVDCGAMPPNLLESELFGHERGAFTGAVSSRQGVFEAANGGTVFLDEIGELSVELQPKLLRVLENREITRIGSNEPIKVNVRLIAATHQDLEAKIAAKGPAGHLPFQIAVGGGEEAHVDLAGPHAAHPYDLPGLDHPQQLGLQGRRQLPHLVEEDGPARRRLQQPRVGPGGPG